MHAWADREKASLLDISISGNLTKTKGEKLKLWPSLLWWDKRSENHQLQMKRYFFLLLFFCPQKRSIIPVYQHIQLSPSQLFCECHAKKIHPPLSRPRSAAGLKNFSFQFPPSPHSSAVWLEGSKKRLFCLIPFPTSLNRNKEYMGRGKKLSGFRSCSMPPSDTLPYFGG